MPDPGFDHDSREAPLIDHLAEVRERILYCLGFFVLIFLLVYRSSDTFIDLLMKPLRDYRPDMKLVALSVTEGFVTTLKLSAYLAMAFSLPFIVWHIWKFIEPGLKPRERFWCKALFVPLMLSFVLGAAFCYTVALPLALRFLLDNLGSQFTPLFSYGSYVEFSLVFMLALGAVFELPLVLVFLDVTGLVPVEVFQGRRREGIVLAFVVGALLSPPDVFSQLCVSLPIIFLLEGGIWVSFLLRRTKKVVE
jgi:sec-independent protein translocase protein TatC